MHWVDAEAEDITEERGEQHLVACGISPSGPIHYGNFREVATADLLNRGLRDAGADSRLVWISDDFDPLRKVYPFLPDTYEEHVGKPLSEVPDPEGCHDSYAKHFEQNFLETLPELGIEPEVKRASQMYADGEYKGAIRTAKENSEEIAEIIEEVTGRDLPRGWRPFNPICEDCGRFAEPKGDEYHCDHGHVGDLKDAHGKLPWRVDWPARWNILGITVEPFGKDHAASGGSYDTGKRISREIYGYEPPHPVVYEQIGLKGEGEMSSSAGIAVTPGELLRIMEPELVRFVIASTKPKKHVELDLGHGLPRLYDELDEAEEQWRNDDTDQSRAFDLSTVNEVQEIDLPLSHAVNAVQVDPEDPLKVLRRTQHSDSGPRVEGRICRAQNWVQDYAPENFLFSVREETPDVELTDQQKEVLDAVATAIESDGDGDEIQNAIYETGKTLDMSLGDAFAAVYRALLDQDNGPRAGPFVASLDQDFVLKRIDELTG